MGNDNYNYHYAPLQFPSMCGSPTRDTQRFSPWISAATRKNHGPA